MTVVLTPDLLLRAYSAGIFPMAERADDPEVFWVDPEIRGILPLNQFQVPKRLARKWRQRPFAITTDTAFEAVIDACAAPRYDNGETWINGPIRQAYAALHRAGHAHSVECWDGELLAGGLYGVSINAAFFGESMFSRRTDASKIALIHLVERLRERDFRLLDTQFVTDHLRQFGAVEVTRAAYQRLLGHALALPASFA